MPHQMMKPTFALEVSIQKCDTVIDGDPNREQAVFTLQGVAPLDGIDGIGTMLGDGAPLVLIKKSDWEQWVGMRALLGYAQSPIEQPQQNITQYPGSSEPLTPRKAQVGQVWRWQNPFGGMVSPEIRITYLTLEDGIWVANLEQGYQMVLENDFTPCQNNNWEFIRDE